MIKAFKYRLYPNPEQREYFAKAFGSTRFIYNRMLHVKIDHYELTGKMLKNTPAQYKAEFPRLKDVDSLALTNAQINLEKAYKNFFRGKNTGFPKFKSKKDNHRSYTTNNQNGTVYIENGHIKIPKLKSTVKIRQHRLFDGMIKSCTISQTPSGKYFISKLVECAIEKMAQLETKVGIDVGLKLLQSYQMAEKSGIQSILENQKTTRKIAERFINDDAEYRYLLATLLTTVSE